MVLKKIALYGASSFTGQAIIPVAVASGLRVHAVSRKPINLPAKYLDYVSEAFLEADRTLVSDNDQGADVAVHLIAPNGEVDGSSAREIADASIASLIALFDAASKGTYRRVIYTGSYWQYDEVGNRCAATTLYTAMKNAADEVACFYARKLDIVNLILFDSYGPNDRRRKILSLVDEAARSGKPLEMTEGDQYLLPIFSSDLAEAFLAAASIDAQVGLRRFWIPGPERLMLRQIVENYIRSRNLKVDIRWGARAKLHHTSNPFVGDCIPNWYAKITFDCGITFL